MPGHLLHLGTLILRIGLNGIAASGVEFGTHGPEFLLNTEP